VDFEHSLNSAIKKLRAALGDSPENSRYIETVPRVGYRFVAPVEQVSAAAPSSANASINNDRSGASVVTTGLGKWKWQRLRGTSLVVVALAASATYFSWSYLHNRSKPQGQAVGETNSGPKANESGGKPPSSPRSTEAHDLYLKGMYFWNKRTVAGFQQAIDCFQQATTIDRNYALAYAGLANSYTLLTAYSSSSATLYMSQARLAAARALELDQGSAEAHTALALIVQNHDWDWQASEKEFRRAIELNPNYATAHQWYGEHLMWRGHFDEALRESERARQLDPLSLIIAADNGAILYFSRQYERAIERFHNVLQKDPNFGRAGGLIIYAYVEKGMFSQALAGAETSHRLYGEGPWYWSMLAYSYGRAGQLGRARRELENLEKMSRHEQLDPVIMLWAHLGVGDKEEALADMERAYSQHFGILTTLKVEPAFDPLRSDPRFQDLLRRVGLADGSITGTSTSKP
jgi:tetratricopeptide (TPR) repeat protein